MTVIHTVTWTALPTATPEKLAAAKEALLTLTAIPGCKRVQFGETFTTERARGYTHREFFLLPELSLNLIVLQSL